MTKYSIVGQTHLGLDSRLVGIYAGTPALLVREPDNPYDANAVIVWVDGKRVGYLPKANNVEIARIIDERGRDHEAVARDGVTRVTRKVLDAVFTRSPNSAYPQIEVNLS